MLEVEGVEVSFMEWFPWWSLWTFGLIKFFSQIHRWICVKIRSVLVWKVYKLLPKIQRHQFVVRELQLLKVKKVELIFGEFHYLPRTTLLVRLRYIVVPLPTGFLLWVHILVVKVCNNSSQGALPQVLEFIFEVQRKMNNEKIKRR